MVNENAYDVNEEPIYDCIEGDNEDHVASKCQKCVLNSMSSRALSLDGDKVTFVPLLDAISGQNLESYKDMRYGLH